MKTIDDTGMKFDGDKPNYWLVPPKSLEALCKVLTFGAKKYAPDNWRKVEKWQERYFSAAQRHLMEYRKGHKIDQESGEPHLAHAICCLAFMIEMEESEQAEKVETYDAVEGYKVKVQGSK